MSILIFTVTSCSTESFINQFPFGTFRKSMKGSNECIMVKSMFLDGILPWFKC